MELYFSVVLVLSSFYFIWWALMCKITNGGFVGGILMKLIPMLLGISLLFMFLKGIGWL